MGKVRTGHATSLDGFIAGPNDGAEAPMGEGGDRLFGLVLRRRHRISTAWHGDGVQGRAGRTPSTFGRRAQRQVLW